MTQRGRFVARVAALAAAPLIAALAAPGAAFADVLFVPDPCVKTGHVSVGNPLAGEYYVSQDGEAAVYVDCPES